MRGRPMMFLDVDGVLNPYGFADAPAAFTPLQLFESEEPVWANPRHGRWIVELQAAYEVVWATSWNADANRLLAPHLGIAPLAALPMPSGPFDPAEKVKRIDRLAADRALAWIHDLHTSEAVDWAERRPEPTLLISANPAIGLTRTMVDQALAWSRLIL